MKTVLVINPGSTSTKIAIYNNRDSILQQKIEHEFPSKVRSMIEQKEIRKAAILKFLQDTNIDIKKLSAIAARGGVLDALQGGAYRINKEMVQDLENNALVEHASNLGAIISYELLQPYNIPAYIYDAVSVDERDAIAKISGIPSIPRRSFCHVLNSRAVVREFAEDEGIDYTDVSCIVAHLGGGISISVHHNGRIIDLISDDEGPFSPERSGRVPASEMVDLCLKLRDKEVLKSMIRGAGGLQAHLGTSSVEKVEAMIREGDEYAELIFQALAYQVAKGIGELSTVIMGNVDAIIITGGLSNSEMLVDLITERVKFLSKVIVKNGEREMEALANGILRVLEGKEKARVYQ